MTDTFLISIFPHTRVSKKIFSIFWSHDVLFGSFCWGHEVKESHLAVRYRACLIISKCYSLDLFQRLWALPDLAWSFRFLQPEQNYSNHPVTFLLFHLSRNKCSCSLPSLTLMWIRPRCNGDLWFLPIETQSNRLRVYLRRQLHARSSLIQKNNLSLKICVPVV